MILIVRTQKGDDEFDGKRRQFGGSSGKLFVSTQRDFHFKAPASIAKEACDE